MHSFIFRCILTALCLVKSLECHVVRGVKALSVNFVRKGWFQTPKEIYALRDVTVDFAKGITAFCGSSGSGKSTLAKVVHGQYPRDEYVGNVAVIDDTISKIPSVYLDPFFYLTYDTTKTVGHYLKNDDTQSVIYKEMYSLFDVPVASVINNLFESQRKFFEILLLFRRMGGLEADDSGLLILDEYLDKDMSSVRSVFFSKIRQLCTKENIKFQVIIVTHSNAVCNSCDRVIALKNGIVYSDGAPEKIMKFLPAEFVLLQ
jgi:ABC-type glutathione transport system ATPase component